MSLIQYEDQQKLRIEALDQAVRVLINPSYTGPQTINNTFNAWTTGPKAGDVIEMAEQFYAFLTKFTKEN
jgi:hypothetical protein